MGASHDETKTSGLHSGVDWNRVLDGVFAGEKRICFAVGSGAEGQSAQDESSVAEPWRGDETICGYFLSGRRGFFRTVGVCRAVSRQECPFHSYWSSEWRNARMVRSPAENVQEDSRERSARTDWDERRHRALSRETGSAYPHGAGQSRRNHVRRSRSRRECIADAGSDGYRRSRNDAKAI